MVTYVVDWGDGHYTFTRRYQELSRRIETSEDLTRLEEFLKKEYVEGDDFQGSEETKYQDGKKQGVENVVLLGVLELKRSLWRRLLKAVT